MVSFTLQGAGYKVIEAFDGQDGYEKAQQVSVDLVLSDVNMPRLDGIGLIKALRELPNYKFTPILMLTTEADSTIRDQARAAGATGFLPKPFDPDGLTDSVMQLLEWHAQTHGSASTH